MRRDFLIITVSILSTHLAHGCQNCGKNCDFIPEDPIGYDPRLEVAYLYKDQWPTGIAITPCGRKFSCYPAGLDALNTNDGCNGKYAVAELTECGDVPYPNCCINNPPGGVIDYVLGKTKGLPDYFISVQALLYDRDYSFLYCLDAGRARDEKQIMYEASPGGTKIVVINTCNDCVVRTYLFPVDVATPNSYFIAMALDGKKDVMYIADAIQYSIIVLDLCCGKSFVAFQGDDSLMPNQGGLPFIWGQPSYEASTTQLGNTTVGSISFGVSMLALSRDRSKLFYSGIGRRRLQSVATAALLDSLLPSSDVAETVQNHGGRGVSLGIITDERGIVWSGSAENNGISFYNPKCPFAKTFLYIRDRRLSWVYAFSEPGDGYMYFTINSLNGLPLVYPGTGPIFEDRRRKPYVLFRFKLPCDGLCPSFCDPATLGLQVCPCDCCS